MQRNGTMAEATPAAETPGTQEPDAPRASEQQASSEGTPTSESSGEQRSGNDWFRQAFNAVRYGGMETRQPEAPAENQDGPESETQSGASQGTVQTSAEGQPRQSNTPATVTPTPAEEQRDTLAVSQAEFDRRVQSETDRRLDKFQREEAERRKRDEKRRLRDTDPYAFAELEKEEEEKSVALQRELSNAHQMTLSTVQTYDKSVLDPLMKAVPEADRHAILSSIEPGLPGRGQAAIQALKVLEREWVARGVANARQELMKDQSFVKEILAKYGGVRQEVEHIPAAGTPAGRGVNVNDSLRAAFGRVRR